MRTIDLNCDLGESFGAYKIGEQEEIYKYITSANIACGFHAGDYTVMRETVEKALEYGVKIGAHPGLPDLQGFGRREMAITPQEAYDLVVYQIGALQAILQTKGAVMQHVKPHGALYNMAARDRALADAIAQAVYDVSPSLILYGLAGSESTAAAEAIGLQTVHEVFADRTYQVDGTLTPRTQPNAIITNEDTAIAQVLLMVQTGHVKSVQGDLVPIKADSICIHGDNPNAVAFVKKLRQALETANIDVKAF